MKKTLTLVLALALTLCSCAFAEQPVLTDVPASAASITTGMAKDTPNRIILSQMDNEPGARPQMGIGSADIVYEIETYNGGATRYTAVFNDEIPEQIEAIRSARIVHADVALEYGGCFIHFGGQQHAGSNVYEYFKSVPMQARIDGISDGNGYFYRDKSRSAPNNVVCRLQKIYENLDWDSLQVKSPLKFSQEGYTRQGEPCEVFSIDYNKSYHPGYVFQDGRYARTYGGNAFVDGITGEQVYCDNVIVQYVTYSWYGGSSDRPCVTTTGTNKCDYFIDGMHFTGYWQRDAVTENTVYYDDAGNEVLFKPGKTYIQVLKDTKEVTIGE